MRTARLGAPLTRFTTAHGMHHEVCTHSLLTVQFLKNLVPKPWKARAMLASPPPTRQSACSLNTAACLRALRDLLQVEAGLTDLQQAYDQLHKDLAGARGADERRTLEEHVRSTPRSIMSALGFPLLRALSLIKSLRCVQRCCCAKGGLGVQLTAVQRASESLQRMCNAMAIDAARHRKCDPHESLCAWMRSASAPCLPFQL